MSLRTVGYTPMGAPIKVDDGPQPASVRPTSVPEQIAHRPMTVRGTGKRMGLLGNRGNDAGQQER